MSLRSVLISLVAVVAILVWGIPSFRQTHWYKLHVADDTIFYRVKVGLSHKGQPIDFDVVVGCGVRVTEHRYDGASIDVSAWYPFVYAKAVPGGHAVLLRTSVDGVSDLRSGGPCRGATSTDGSGDYRRPHAPGVAVDWLPILVWYDRVDDLSHGLAYVTQDAYASPAAQMEFHGATVEHATRADFDRFMAEAPRNLVPAYNAGSMTSLERPRFHKAGEVPAEMARNPRLAWTREEKPLCRGVQRIPLDEAQRAMVRALWPADHPHVWLVRGDQARDIKSKIFDTAQHTAVFWSGLFTYALSNTPDDRGTPVEVFPLVPDVALSRVDRQVGSGPYKIDIEIGDGRTYRGMMSCDSEASDQLEEAVTGRAPIPGHRLNDNLCVFILGDKLAPTPIPCAGQAVLAFIDDQYVIRLASSIAL